MGRSVHKIVAILIGICVSCSQPRSVEDAYREAWSAYVSGDLPRSLEKASKASRHDKDRNSPWFWKFRLLKAEVLTIHAKVNEAEALLKEAVPDRPELTQLEVRRLIDLAQLRPSDKSAEILRQASSLVKDGDLGVRIKLVEGIIALNHGRIEASEAAFRVASEMAASQQNQYWLAQALSNWSVSRKRASRYEEAIDLARRALTAAESVGARRVAALARGNLGSSYAYLGEFEAAFEHEEKAIEILEAIGDKSNLMIALGELGLMYDRKGDSQRAIPNYERAYRLALDLGKTADAERHANNLSLAFVKIRQWDTAENWNRRGFELASSSKDPRSTPFLQRNQARIAYGRGLLEEAAALCQQLLLTDSTVRWEAHELLGQIHSDAKQFGKANLEFDKALKLIESTRSELLNSQYRMTLLARWISFYQRYVAALVEQNNDYEALRIAESSRARVLSERLGRDLKLGQFPGLSGVRSLASSSNSSLLSFWLAPTQSLAWLITPHGVRRFNLPPAGEIEKLITGYRQSIEHSITDPVSRENPFGAKLWNTVMADIAPHIPKNSRLIVIPDGALHRLNLETLVASSPQPHYWIEDVEIAVAPSIAIAASKPAPVSRRAASLLLIGAPDYKGTNYETLEKAGSEILGIQARFAGAMQAVYTGPQASPAAYREADPARFSIIHFAAHAEANQEKPLESAVILSSNGYQRKLYARDVIDVPLRADLVTISACRSAGVRAYAGEGLIGFAWAFLQAGARAVAAGLWDVNDESTQLLMNQFYTGITSGHDTVSAMRAAKLALLKGEPRHRKPYYWAPFQVYVGSAMR